MRVAPNLESAMPNPTDPPSAAPAIPASLIGRLRKALNRGREADPIRTVRGAGYALDDRFGRSAA